MIELAVISFQLKTMLFPCKYKLHKSIPRNEHESQGNILKEDRSLQSLRELPSQKSVLPPENVIGRAVRLSRARTDRDFTGSVGPGLED